MDSGSGEGHSLLPSNKSNSLVIPEVCCRYVQGIADVWAVLIQKSKCAYSHPVPNPGSETEGDELDVLCNPLVSLKHKVYTYESGHDVNKARVEFSFDVDDMCGVNHAVLLMIAIDSFISLLASSPYCETVHSNVATDSFFIRIPANIPVELCLNNAGFPLGLHGPFYLWCLSQVGANYKGRGGMKDLLSSVTSKFENGISTFSLTNKIMCSTNMLNNSELAGSLNYLRKHGLGDTNKTIVNNKQRNTRDIESQHCSRKKVQQGTNRRGASSPEGEQPARKTFKRVQDCINLDCINKIYSQDSDEEGDVNPPNKVCGGLAIAGLFGSDTTHHSHFSDRAGCSTQKRKNGSMEIPTDKAQDLLQVEGRESFNKWMREMQPDRPPPKKRSRRKGDNVVNTLTFTDKYFPPSYNTPGTKNIKGDSVNSAHVKTEEVVTVGKAENYDDFLSVETPDLNVKIEPVTKHSHAQNNSGDAFSTKSCPTSVMDLKNERTSASATSKSFPYCLPPNNNFVSMFLTGCEVASCYNSCKQPLKGCTRLKSILTKHTNSIHFKAVSTDVERDEWEWKSSGKRKVHLYLKTEGNGEKDIDTALEFVVKCRKSKRFETVTNTSNYVKLWIKNTCKLLPCLKLLEHGNHLQKMGSGTSNLRLNMMKITAGIMQIRETVSFKVPDAKVNLPMEWKRPITSFGISSYRYEKVLGIIDTMLSSGLFLISALNDSYFIERDVKVNRDKWKCVDLIKMATDIFYLVNPVNASRKPLVYISKEGIEMHQTESLEPQSSKPHVDSLINSAITSYVEISQKLKKREMLSHACEKEPGINARFLESTITRNGTTDALCRFTVDYNPTNSIIPYPGYTDTLFGNGDVGAGSTTSGATGKYGCSPLREPRVYPHLQIPVKEEQSEVEMDRDSFPASKLASESQYTQLRKGAAFAAVSLSNHALMAAVLNKNTFR